MTGYLRQYIPGYAMLAEPLQLRKTNLSKTLSSMGCAQQNVATRLAILSLSTKELESFANLQKSFANPSYLVHHDLSQHLYLDINASKEFGFRAVIYHYKLRTELNNANAVKNNSNLGKRQFTPQYSDIQPIMFLSKMLSPAERNYWPTEMEVACLVWVIKKL